MTGEDSQRDQNELLLVAYRRLTWLRDSYVRIKQGDAEFRNRPAFRRLHVEAVDAIDGVITAHGGKLLGRRLLSSRDQVRCQRAKRKLQAAGLIELHADDGSR